MIYYLVTERHTYTMGHYLTSWDEALASRVEIVTYESLESQTVLPAGTYIFSDLGRLSRQQIEWAASLSSRLMAAGQQALNRPDRVIRRYDLLRMLHARGDNDFAAYRLSDTHHPRRFPVFLRPERDHEVSTPLLQTQEELEGAIAGMLGQGHCLEEILMVEFCDTSDANGVFCKYGTFVVGHQVVPAHVFFGPEWAMKIPTLADDERASAEWEYMTRNPHKEWIRRMFRLANVEYGRIDYSFLNGKPQVWEINTNPTVLAPRSDYGEWSRPRREYFARQFTPVIEALDLGPAPACGFSIAVGPGVGWW